MARNSIRKTIEANSDSGIGGTEVHIEVEYNVGPGAADEAAGTLRNLASKVAADLDSRVDQ